MGLHQVRFALDIGPTERALHLIRLGHEYTVKTEHQDLDWEIIRYVADQINLTKAVTPIAVLKDEGVWDG